MMEEHHDTGVGGLLWAYVCWSVAASVGQLVFGVLGDRRSSPWLIWGGPLLAIVSLCSVGLAQNTTQLAALFIFGGLGVAAFHPEAATTAGSLMPERRSQAMAIFALCGYLGQAAGPYYGGVLSDRWGLLGLRWGMAWELPLLAVITVALLWTGVSRRGARQTRLTASKTASETTSPPLPDSATTSLDAPSLYILALLLAVGVLRVLPAIGAPHALSYLLKAADAPQSVIGAVQSAFMVGIGVGAMGCAVFLRSGHERLSLWLFPLLAGPLVATLGQLDGWLLVAVMFVCGFLLGITMPVYISYGQKLLPQGQRVASSITMGVSWGVGGGIVALSMGICNRFGALSSIFIVFAAASVLSSALTTALPKGA